MMAKAYAGFTLAQMKVIAVSLDEQIAAANARIAELESKRETCFSNYAKATGKLAERAEAGHD